MTGSPLVSVVMCSYNGLASIDRAIGSILAQSYANWELLVSDDGSTDGTRDYLSSLDDPRIRIILRPDNVGYVANKNAALAEARGALVTQQDQDDVSHPDRLALQVAALERTGLAIVGCGYDQIDLAGRISSRSQLEQETVIAAYDPATRYPFWFPALMFRRDVLAAVGPFDDYFAGAFGDDLYWTAKANQQFPILCIPDRLYGYVESPASITSLPGSDRKLIMGEMLDHLLRQRRVTGTDDLEQGTVAALEARLLADKNLLARKLQVYAARAIDQGRLSDARSLIRRAFKLAPLRPALLRTIVYHCRAAVRGSRAGR